MEGSEYNICNYIDVSKGGAGTHAPSLNPISFISVQLFRKFGQLIG